jgi:hypothetical protein
MFTWIAEIWKSNWKNKIMLIAGALILVGSIVGIIYGVVTHQGDEGLMKVNGKSLHWAKEDLPLICSYDPTTVTEDHLALYNKAKSEFNTRTGITLLSHCMPWMIQDKMPTFIAGSLTLRVITPEPAPAAAGTTTVDVEDPFKAHPGGVTLYRYEPASGLLKGAAVFVDPGAPKDLLERIWLHEIGHSLGLEHDRLQASIMYPAASGRPKSLSEKDVKLLQATYR